MMRPSLIRLFLILSSLALPHAMGQTTETLADPNTPGGLIIQVVNTDINGLPVTQIVGSIPPGGVAITNPLAVATTPPLAVTTTKARTKPTIPVAAVPVGQGPVGQPAPTIPPGQGVTEYTYTTTDALGQTTILSDIFTPTYNTPSPPRSPAVGTVLGLSAWSALIGTNTVGAPTNSADGWPSTRTFVRGLLALVCGVAAGAWTVL